MDELQAFFNNPKPIKLRGSLTSGMRLRKDDITSEMNRNEKYYRSTSHLSGTSYTEPALAKETQSYLKNEDITFTKDDPLEPSGLSSMEQLSTVQSENISGELTNEAMTEVYNKYTFKAENNKFAINDYKQQILDTVCSNPVVIIQGPTGCGKTTQVPQWILDDSYVKRRHCKIVVTQPRRIAAISIAKRVAQERGWSLGDVVGYQVGLENKTSTDTRIEYVTNGVLLQKLVNSKTLNEYTHVILDEVHERGQDMDFLLLIVKKLVLTVSKNVRVILMSATFNVDSFSNYFLMPVSNEFERSPCIYIDKERTYLVKTFYLHDLAAFGEITKNDTFKIDEPKISEDMYNLVVKLLQCFDQIDVREDNYDSTMDSNIPSVLIFLPGINEIETLYNLLVNQSTRQGTKNSSSLWVLPLHSTITADEQVRVFLNAPAGHRKVILSTNIAESSITVPDIKYVIDFCLMKELVADPFTNFTSLRLSWASQTNCKQRSGRAGRVRDGRVYRLVPEGFYKNSFNKECTPEIIRCPLERLVLLAKMLDMGPPTDILALAMDPPDLSNIHRTILSLKEIGALKKMLAGEWDDIDGDLTYLGRVCAKLPVDVRVSKLIMLGHIFGCLEETVIIGAAMSVKNMFSNPFKERLNAYNSRLTWADGSSSDCIAYLNVYKVWSHLRQQGCLKGNAEVQWARRFFVQVRSLREIEDLVKELSRRLSREGIETLKCRSPWSKSEMPLVLKVLLAGAFYPHYFIQVSGDENREREALKVLGGHDPRTTVYLKDFPSDQPGPLYTSSIKNIVRQLTGDEPRVTFDQNTSKVYLSFADSSHSDKRENDKKQSPIMPGKVLLPVYKAIKIRQLNMAVQLALLPPNIADKKLTEFQSIMSNVKNQMVPRLPDIDDTHVPIKISQFINCGRFWAQYDDRSTWADLDSIHKALNSRSHLVNTDSVNIGDLFAAPYEDPRGLLLYRARVQKILPENMVWVLYVDYGGYARVKVNSLHILPVGICQELPPLAMECVMAEVAPSLLRDLHGNWTMAAVQHFQDLIKNGRLHGKIYSVCHGVVSLELLAEAGKVSVNKELVKRGLAQLADESYESKMNHDLRASASELNLSQKRAFNKQQEEQAAASLLRREIDLFHYRDCTTSVHLKGPYSPLESIVYTMMDGSKDKSVSIDSQSINSVFLDTEPQEIYERLLVAGSVGQNQNGRLCLRQTTLMPHIPGLPAILALLFCPTTELRRDPNKMRYVSALCGLGALESGRPMYPEHDMLVNIDVDLSLEDLKRINHIRHLMDYMMYCGEGQDVPTVDDRLRQNVPTTIREEIMSLLWCHRRHRERFTVPNAWQWKCIPEEEYLEYSGPDVLGWQVIYPLHTPLELRPLTQEDLFALKKDNDQLKMLIGRSGASSKKDVVCKLCESCPMSLQAMRIHLYSQAHREKEEDLVVFQT